MRNSYQRPRSCCSPSSHFPPSLLGRHLIHWANRGSPRARTMASDRFKVHDDSALDRSLLPPRLHRSNSCQRAGPCPAGPPSVCGATFRPITVQLSAVHSPVELLFAGCFVGGVLQTTAIRPLGVCTRTTLCIARIVANCSCILLSGGSALKRLRLHAGWCNVVLIDLGRSVSVTQDGKGVNLVLMQASDQGREPQHLAVQRFHHTCAILPMLNTAWNLNPWASLSNSRFRRLTALFFLR
jgi:hypothetical protein